MKHLNVHKLRCDLNKVCNELDDLYDINCGGCCFLAYLVANQLDKLGLNYHLVVYSDASKHLGQISYEVITKTKQRGRDSVVGDCSCFHYAIYLEGAGIINGMTSHCRGYHIKGVHASNIRWIYNMGGWSDVYEVKYNVAVRKIIKSFFNDRQKVSETRKGSKGPRPL